MASITLERTVKPVAYVRDGKVIVENDVKTVVVKFVDGIGNRISIAFDGRFDYDKEGLGNEVNEVYSRYTDCPIMYNGQQSGPVSDCDALRLMRDALNKMDLG